MDGVKVLAIVRKEKLFYIINVFYLSEKYFHSKSRTENAKQPMGKDR